MQMGEATMQHWSHDHPLVFTQHHQNNGREEADCCSMCEELIQGSSSCCTHPDCKFYLHNVCALLSPEIHHPFFHRHPLKLQAKSPSHSGYSYCNICYDRCEFFYYCVPCDYAVDVKCALLPQFIAGDYSKVEHVCHEHPLISATKRKRSVKLFLPCAACKESTPGPIYSCADCTFYIHKKCCELPTQITHPSHHRHPLLLLTDVPPHPNHCSCHLCKNHIKGFIYHCSLCEFDLKIKHVFSSEVEIGNHEHPFTRVTRPVSFICDGCGTGGDSIPYICSQCNLVVHSDCIWLPKVIKITRHTHPISHMYFLSKSERDIWDCRICYSEVNTEYGSYYCSNCKYIVHVNCAVEFPWLEQEIQDQNYNETLRFLPDDSMTSAKEITATEIKHFSHQHNLKLGEETKSCTFCDGCVQPISSHPFYFCKQCDFFLHKSCAILPMKTRCWFFPTVLTHIPYGIFKCFLCKFYCSGFHYRIQIEILDLSLCLRCFGISDIIGHQGHEHPLFFDIKYGKDCSACGTKAPLGYRCKYNNFGLCYECISLPKSTQHKNHEHPLALTYHNGDDISQHYCDICEEERDQSYWFYGCPNCDFTAHIKCTLGKYPFIKRGIKFRHKCHLHRLTTVQKVYYYPLCEECEEPCIDLAVECEEPECNYISHWECLELTRFFPITDSYGKETCQ